MRMDFLSIFLEDFRGPRKTILCLTITGSKSSGNHGALRANDMSCSTSSGNHGALRAIDMSC